MNYKIVIDAGHGGEDSGAVGNGIVEKDLTLKISEYIYNRLNELNVPVSMTRTFDETLSPNDRVNRILGFYGNNPDVIVISNHINAGGGDGSEVIYALRNNNNLATSILNSLKASGQNVRDVYQRRLPSDPSKDYYFIHRNTGRTQPIIVEYGFLDSKGDDVNQLKNNYEGLAESVVKALVEYIGVSYTPPFDEYYIVKSGDSLWSIAKRYGISVDKLKEANNLENNVLKIGQTLIIPTNNEIENPIVINETEYIVKPGDTLYSISKNYNISIDDIKKINNLNDNTLSVGQILKLSNDNQNYIEYIVKPGDTLYGISKTYNISQQELMNYNNLKTNLLSIGQIIKIPTITNKYIVKPGDTLYSIALANKKTVDEIKQKNNLITNILSIGQELII